MKPVPVNEAEAIIEPFWDPQLSGLPHWQIDPGPAHGLRVFQNWCWAQFEWTARPHSGPALRMTRQVAIDCGGYDRLLVSVMAPEHSILVVTARTDRGDVRFRSPPSPLKKKEYAIELLGARRIESICLEFEPAAEGLASGWLNWIGLQDSSRLDHYLRTWERFDERWEGFLKPEDYEPSFQPLYEAVLTNDEWKTLREKHESASQSGPSPFDIAAEQARAVLPESRIRNFVNFWGDSRYNRERDHDRQILTYGLNAAVAAHLRHDKSLLRLAARYAFSIAMCEHWDDGFICRFPGSTFDHRCFVQSLCAYDVAAILDLAGEMMTDHGRDFLRRRLAEEGLGIIQYNTWRYDYIFDCNQLAWFTPGRMLAMAVLEEHWPRVKPYREIACADLRESLDRTILPDGGYVEGPTYFRCVGRDAGLGIYYYARAAGLSMEAALPPSMKRCGDFAEALISTDTEADVIPICDAHFLHESISQSIMASLLPASAWARMLRKTRDRQGRWPIRVTGSTQVPNMLDAAIAWQLMDTLPVEPPAPRPFVSLPDMGVLASQRTFEGEPVKILIMGNRANAGHTHEDKGSFVLEFAGETFAMDPGTCDYSHPLAGILGHVERHNMLVPAGLVERPCPQCPLPADVKPSGHGDNNAFHAEIDVTPGWERHYRKWHRAWDSASPDTLTITDDYELTAGDGVSFYWQTRLPAAVEGTRATIIGKRGTVILDAPGDCDVRLEELPLLEGTQNRIAITRHARSGTLTVRATLKRRG